MNGILREIEQRRARRGLTTAPVPEETMERILSAAVLAPSCFNNQPWRFLAVSDEKELNRVKMHLSEGNYWAKKAPLVVLVLTKAELDCKLNDNREYALFDTGLAVQNLVLQATKEGLVAHPIAGFKPVEIKKEFEIPESYTLITLIVIGYPGDDTELSEKHKELEHSQRDRKPVETVVFRNAWKGQG